MAHAVHPLEVLRRPIITEKGQRLAGGGKYLFEVARDADKRQVRSAVEAAFNVRVKAVNVLAVRGAHKRTAKGTWTTAPWWKKAIVTLAPGERIQFFEGV